jgi:hypothetical protein
MIHFVTGPRASGVGLIRHVLVRGEVESEELPPFPGDGWDPDPDVVYIGSRTAYWLRDYADRAIVIVRCPVAAMLTIFDQEAKRAGRKLVDEEMEFYASLIVRHMTYVNCMVFQHGCPFFAFRKGERMQSRFARLIEMISGRPGLVRDGDTDLFFRASERQVYRDMSMVPSRVVREIRRTGGMYGKLNLDMEIR